MHYTHPVRFEQLTFLSSSQTKRLEIAAGDFFLTPNEQRQSTE